MSKFLGSASNRELGVIAVMLLLTAPVATGATSCPLNRTEVRVAEKIAPAQIDDSKTASQLASMRFDLPIASDRRFVSLTGLTVSGITVDEEIRFARSGPDSGPFCVWPSVVTVTISAAAAIYLTADHGQCLQMLGLEHERRHVAVTQNTANRYALIFRRRVGSMASAIDEDRSSPVDDPQTLRSRMEEKVSAMVSVTSDLLYADWAADQRAVDSAAEYRRISNACLLVTEGGSSRIN